mmetsp:Transcript_45650/g.114864  ORF Transcript_45650/g.114864 Transcript_45650/m.114864 type:complete len:200 (-) Transcript_45650:191-790(-)|eukprot:CAMPEP_0177638830 /NCGR_PEP_ID=MMETSP0447-20121125/5700_1 /TAXON_ID=0 /ORGANISM="Stygamoeba regulata, Strain BSH-02190019" /LENGTH=199 /DNA_ID=CAMNT_0019140823 /DNA_START=45 /DNA_END=644 /DNA_ORIENTATION=+
MNLPEDVIKGFQTLGNDSPFTNETLSAVMEAGIASIQGRHESLENLKSTLSSLDPLILKQAVNSIVGLVVEAVKMNSESMELKSVLSDLRVADSLAEVFISKYEVHKPTLRSLHSSTAFHYPHVVGLDWRLDYQVKGSNLERIDTPLYFLSFQTEAPKLAGADAPNTSSIEFCCTVEELQDLYAQVRDAAKQMERMVAP